MSLGKAINDAEGLLASKEVELLRLREEERALESKDVAMDHSLDSTAYVAQAVCCFSEDITFNSRLKLQICRSLGFEPILDSNNNIIKVLVRK